MSIEYEVLDIDRKIYADVYRKRSPKYASDIEAGKYDDTALMRGFVTSRITEANRLLSPGHIFTREVKYSCNQVSI